MPRLRRLHRLRRHVDRTSRPQRPGNARAGQGRDLCALLKTNDFEGFAATLKAWLSGIPYQWHATGDLARHEAWYASLLHMVFRAIGVDVRAEEATSRGRADMVVPLGDEVFVIEFKMAEGADDAEAALAAAFAQMRDRGYADRYRGQPVHLVAVACGREARNLLEVRAAPNATD